MSSTRNPRIEAVGPETEDRMVWRGVMAAFLQDDTRLIDLEGAFRSSKTTACLRKVARSCLRYPGIHWWLNRYSDGDTQRQLKPQWDRHDAADGHRADAGCQEHGPDGSKVVPHQIAQPRPLLTGLVVAMFEQQPARVGQQGLTARLRPSKQA